MATEYTAEAPPVFVDGGSNNGAHSATSSSSSSPFTPSLTIIILILVTTVIVSIGICLLLRYVNRRCIRHLSTATSASVTSSVAPVDSLRHSSRRVSPANTANSDRPSNSAVIDSLPIFTFASVTRRTPSTFNGGDCAVCLSKFEPHDQLRLLPLCCHAFHVDCIDTWLATNQTCPLCRSPLHISDSELAKTAALGSSIDTGSNSFRLQIGSISRRHSTDFGEPRSIGSYSVGSFDYIVDEESEIFVNQTHQRSISDKESEPPAVSNSTAEQNLAADVGSGRGWLHDYVDRLSSLSSHALSFRSSGRFFPGSSRRSDVVFPGDYDLEGNRVGEEISEMFRWFSGV